ncbi:MAG: lipopolysaccharide biosynthesis protein [Chitinophagaceae bacterium]|nr:lipopolysaccharide biosynthesis protein [Chitinophagaceae bacterium]
MYKAFLWDFFSRFSNQLISFIVSVFLTRLLLPEEFGIMGIALVVISFSTIFVDLGLGKAIIQQKEVSKVQLSTVFFLNTGISLLFTLACFLAAGPLASFFDQPALADVLQVVSLSFVFYGLNVVPNALLYRQMNFKVISIISTLSALFSGLIGIYMAKGGYGVWSLVVQNLSMSFLIFTLTFLYARWLPGLQLVFAEIRNMWRYSYRLFLSALLDNVFTRLDIFLIGKIFSPATLGYYTRAQSMDGIIKQTSSASIVTVLFPYLSRVQSETAIIRVLFIQYLHIICFVSFFLSGLLYICADSIFIMLFTERWLKAAALFKIMTIAGFVYPVSALMVNILSSRGNSKDFLRAEIIKKLVILPAYIFGFLLGLNGFVYTLAAVYILALFVNVLYVEKEIQVSFIKQVRIIFLYAVITLAVVVLVYMLRNFFPAVSLPGKILLEGSGFFLFFLLLSAITGTEGYKLVFRKIKSIAGQ